MSAADDWTVILRPGSPPAAPWGLYSQRRDRWINVPFADELDAARAAAVLAAAHRGTTA